MDGTPLAWLEHSPSRSPAWRWLRATWLRERAEPADPRCDDRWVGRALRFLAAQGQPVAAGKRPRLDPAVRAALALAHEDPPERRWLVEALLLTDVPCEEVARRCAVGARTVEAYHQLFYDVRPRLAATDWVMSQVCASAGRSGRRGN
jgi:hypothetical protein